MKQKSTPAARQVDPLLRELYAVKASLNRKAKFDVKLLCAQVRKCASAQVRKCASAQGS